MKFLLGFLLGLGTAMPVALYVVPPQVVEHTVKETIVEPADVPEEESQETIDTSPVSRGLFIEQARVDENSDIRVSDLEPNNDQDYTIISTYGNDGYRMEKAEVDRDLIQLKIYKYRSAAAFRQAMNRAGMDSNVDGLSFWHPDSNECVILIEDPAYNYKPSTIGHELTHCMYGSFHVER